LVSAKDPQITVNSQKQSRMAAIRRHSRDCPHVPKKLTKQPFFHGMCRNLSRR
jgi:hypothetical protein